MSTSRSRSGPAVDVDRRHTARFGVPLLQGLRVTAVGDDRLEGRLQRVAQLGVVLAYADAVGARLDLRTDHLEVAAATGGLRVVGRDGEVVHVRDRAAGLELEQRVGVL